jgi:hypothetical protein
LGGIRLHSFSDLNEFYLLLPVTLPLLYQVLYCSVGLRIFLTDDVFMCLVRVGAVCTVPGT